MFSFSVILVCLSLHSLTLQIRGSSRYGWNAISLLSRSRGKGRACVSCLALVCLSTPVSLWAESTASDRASVEGNSNKLTADVTAATRQEILEQSRHLSKVDLPERSRYLQEQLKAERWSTGEYLLLAFEAVDAVADLGGVGAALDIIDTALQKIENRLQVEELDGVDPLVTIYEPALRGLESFLQGDYLLAEEVMEQALRNARNLGKEEDLGRLLEIFGEILYTTGKVERGNASFREAAELARQLGDRSQMARLLLYAGTSGSAQALDVSMSETLDTLKIFQEEGDLVGLGMAYQNMGYDYFKDPEDHYRAFLSAIDFASRSGDILTDLAARAGLAETYFIYERNEEAIEMITQALEVLREVESPNSRAHVYRVAGLVFSTAQDPQLQAQAEDYLRYSLERYKGSGDIELQMAAQESLAEYYLINGRYEEALPLAEEARDWTRQFTPATYPGSLALVAAIQEAMGDFEGAVATWQEYITAREADWETGTAERLELLQQDYEGAIAQRENEILRSENALLNSRIERDNLTRQVTLAAGFMAVLLLLILYRLYSLQRDAVRSESRLNLLLRRQKQALEEKSAELIENNQQLIEANARFKEIDERRRELLGLAAHDMKNPLWAVHSSLDLIRDEWLARHKSLDDSTEALLDSSRESLDHILSLIDRILRAQTAESIEESLHNRLLDPGPIARQVIDLNRSNAQRKSIDIELKINPEVRLYGDAQAVREILDNLVSNAVKYSPPGKQVDVLIEKGEGEALFFVRDRGPGFRPQDMIQLFKPFAKLSAVPTGGESSSGLGLSIVKGLAEAMSGRVQASNRKGGGAELFLRLPSQPPPDEPGKSGPSTTTLSQQINKDTARNSESPSSEATAG